MSDSIDLAEGLELRDASGSTLGVFLPQRILNELVSERDSLRLQVVEARQEVDRLRRVIAENGPAATEGLRAERDAYLKTLHALLRKEITFDAQELREMESNGITVEQILAEVGQIVSEGARRSDD
jgi:uncharacterized coiled-coil DUF342 family protein